MEPLEFIGKTTEEALTKASDHFQLPMDKLEVVVVSAGSSGLLGLLGAKKARILVRPLGASAKEAMDEVMREFRGESPTAIPSSTNSPNLKALANSSLAQSLTTTKRHAIADYNDLPKEQTTEKFYGKKDSFEDELDSAVADIDQDYEFDNFAPTREPESQELVESSRLVLEHLVSSLDSVARVTARNGHGFGIELEIDGGEVGILIGRRGQTLDALQYLTTRIISHQEGRPVRINVDAGGYRRRRRESLEELALRMADKARSTRRPVSVGPLSSPERRVVHLALKGERGVSTSSRGRGELKKVLISPRN
jgi:spoIIIJ-associated protein